MNKKLFQKVMSSLLAIIMIVGMIPMTAFANTLDTQEGNLALGATVAAMLPVPASPNGAPTLIDPQPATLANVTDGIYGTHCYADAGQYAHKYQIVMPDSDQNAGIKVNKLKLTFNPHISGDNALDLITVKVTNDYSTWTTVGEFTKVDISEQNTLEIVLDEPQDVWVVWVEGWDPVDETGTGMFFAEFEAYFDVSLIKPDTQEGNLALGGEVTAMLPVPASPNGDPTPIDPQPAEVVNVTDGTYSTSVNAGAGQYAHKYQIVLPGAEANNGVKVNNLKLTFGSHICGDNALDSIVVKVTNDYVTWTEVGRFNKVDVSEQNTLEIVLDEPQDVWVVWVEGWDPVNETGTGMFFAEFEAYYDESLVVPDIEEENLALGATVAAMLPVPASPNGAPTLIDPQPETLVNVTDGSYDTHCYADGGHFAHKYQIVMPGSDQNAGVKVNKLKLTFNPHIYGDNALDLITVKVTNNYSTWTTVGEFTKVDVSAQTTLEIVLDKPEDVWVVWVEGWDPLNETGTAMFFAEFEAYYDESLVKPDIAEGNLALGGTVTAMLPMLAGGDIIEPQPKDVANVTDGSYNTHCYADAGHFAHKYQIVMPGSDQNAGVKVNKLKLTFNQHILGDNALDSIVVKVTNDYSTWKTVGNFTKVDVSKQNTLTIEMAPEDVWVVWVEGWDSLDETGTGMFFAEFEAYYDESSPRIMTESTTEYSENNPNAIYPLFADNYKYQHWSPNLEGGVADYYQFRTNVDKDYTWSIINGKLPKGMALTSDGKLQGKTTEEGTFTITVRAEDAQGETLEKELTIVSNPYRAQWHTDAKFGAMIQWGAFTPPTSTANIPAFEARATNFDADKWMDTLASYGVKILNFTVVGGDAVRLWPSTTPSMHEKKTQRDYVGELIEAAHERGIKFIAYLPGGFAWPDENGIVSQDHHKYDISQSTLQKGLMLELIDKGVDGFWIDSIGSYYGNKVGEGYELTFDWEDIMPAIRAKNPYITVSVNGGTDGNSARHQYTDIVTYEGFHVIHSDADFVDLDMMVAERNYSDRKMGVEIDQMLQNGWAYTEAVDATIYETEEIIQNIKDNWDNGVTFMASIAVKADGTLMSDAALEKIAPALEWAGQNIDSYPFGQNDPLKADKAEVAEDAAVFTAFNQYGGNMISSIIDGSVDNAYSLMGLRFTTGANPVIVTHLGRYKVDGNNQVHSIRLVKQARISTPERIVELDLSTAVPEADGFAYAKLENPIILEPNSTYFILSSENTTDKIAKPNINYLRNFYGLNVADTAWTDISATTMQGKGIQNATERYSPLEVAEDAIGGGLVNFKATVVNATQNMSLTQGKFAWFSDENDNPTSDLYGSCFNPYPIYAVDGDPSTTAIPINWNNKLHIDLGEIRNGVNQIQIDLDNTRDYQVPTKIEVYGSSNGSDYSKLATIYNTAQDDSVVKSFDAKDIRYIYIKSNNKPIYREVYLFSSNIALHSNAGFVEGQTLNLLAPKDATTYASFAIDGSKFTTATAGVANSSLFVDLNGTATVKTLKTVSSNNSGLVFYTSTNGTSWTEVARTTDHEAAVTLASAQTAKYLLVSPIDSNEAVSLIDLQIYAESYEHTAPNAPTPIVSFSGTSIGGPTADGWHVMDWTAGTADTVKVTVDDTDGGVSTITVNGAAYNSGDDIVITEAGTITVVVTTTKSGCNTVTRTYTIVVSPETLPDATAPAVTLSGSATVDGWVVTEWTDDANTVAVNVADAEGFTSTVTVNGEAYVSGSDITLTEEGTITVVVTTTADRYNAVTSTYTITVPAKTEPEVPQEIGSEVYTIESGFIRKIEVGTTVNELLENVTPAGGDIKVYKSETAATAMRGTVAVGTGNVVKLFDDDGNVVDSLTVVILGDVSGDGKINATDLISLVAYIAGEREYTDAQTISANLQQPARPTINAQDLAYLKGAMDGTKTIVQS